MSMLNISSLSLGIPSLIQWNLPGVGRLTWQCHKNDKQELIQTIEYDKPYEYDNLQRHIFTFTKEGEVIKGFLKITPPEEFKKRSEIFEDRWEELEDPHAHKEFYEACTAIQKNMKMFIKAIPRKEKK